MNEWWVRLREHQALWLHRPFSANFSVGLSSDFPLWAIFCQKDNSRMDGAH